LRVRRAWYRTSPIPSEGDLTCVVAGIVSEEIMEPYRMFRLGAVRGRLARLSLATMLATGLVASAPAVASADTPYPVYSVTVHYYPMYTANTTVINDILSVGCVPLFEWNAEIAVGCSIAGLIISIIPSNQFSGYWADYVLQTSQVFVHAGSVCNSNKANCSAFWKWDVYAKAAYLSQNNSTYSLMTSSSAPAFYGYSRIGYSIRIPVNSIQLANILSGHGL
jgi:hypothetical protein